MRDKLEEWFTDEQREKQRIQQLLLREIYAVSDAPVFKGGTAMEIAYGLNRFSEDLDFDLDKGEIAVISEAINNLDSKVINIENDWESEITRHSSMQVFILDFYSNLISARISIKIDVVFDTPIIPPIKKMIKSEGNPIMLKVMDTREILAEKVNAIMDEKRDQPRDLYDLKFLLEKGTNIDFHLIYLKSKSRVFGDVPKYSLKKFSERIDLLGKKWEELKPYVKELPEFKKTRDYVLSIFKLLA
jgi:predicted nucleotidyltransferase component of viral defense system